MDKEYLTAQGLLEDSFRLAAKILEDDFQPTLMIAVWRGGVPMGIAVQEFLEFHGVATDHIAIRTSSYSGIDNQQREVKVFGLNYLIKNVKHTDRLLIVDDVFDTGRSLEAIIAELKRKHSDNLAIDGGGHLSYIAPTRVNLALVQERFPEVQFLDTREH